MPEYQHDMRSIMRLVSNSGPLRTYCATRLDIIDHLFVFHTMLNDHIEHKVFFVAFICSLCKLT